MDRLNKTFTDGKILYASELNAIVSKLNDVIASLGAVTPGSSVTSEQLRNEINAASNELRSLINSLNDGLTSVWTKINSMDDGNHEYETDEEYMRFLKQTINGLSTSLLLDLNLLTEYIDQDTGETKYKPTVTLGIIKDQISQDTEKFNTAIAALEAEYTEDHIAVGLMANCFEEYVDPVDGLTKKRPIYNGASIIASINNITGESTVGIDADKITIAGDTTLKGKLSALELAIAGKLSADSLETITADVTNAVIGRLEAGDVTITGDLRYNRIIANTQEVPYNETLSGTQLDDGTYFVKVTNTNSSDYVKLFLPANPVEGQTIFIDCCDGYFELKSNKDIHYYRKVIIGTTAVIRTGDYTGGDSPGIYASSWGWNGVVEFIYTGTYWQQLVHNIDTSTLGS